MGKTTRKRSLSSKNRKDDTDDSSSTSDSENEVNEAGDAKRSKKGDNKEWSGSEEGSDQSTDIQSKTKAVKDSKNSSTPDDDAKKPTKEYVRRTKERGWGKTLEIESVITHGITANQQKSRKYKVKLKDETTIWISAQMLAAMRPDLVRQYKEDIDKGNFVEAIVSHERQKNSRMKYLIRWADKSKGETWETKGAALKVCRNLLIAYIESMEEKETEANAVTAILGHKVVDHRAKYLIQWQDKSKGKTWETTKRTIALCPNILDKFTMKNPDCVPENIKDLPGVSKFRPRSQLKHRNRYYKDPSLLDDFDDDVDWEVERIVDICEKRDNTREFLVRWKGFRSAYDSWLPESDLDCPELMKRFMKSKAERDRLKRIQRYGNGRVRKVESRRGKSRDKKTKNRSTTTSKEKPKDRSTTTSKEKPKDRSTTTIKETPKIRSTTTSKAKPKIRSTTTSKAKPKIRSATVSKNNSLLTPLKKRRRGVKS